VSPLPDGRGSENSQPSAEECFQHAQALHAREEYDRAVEEYTEAIRLSPGHLMALLERGRLHRSRGQLDEALEDFNAAICVESRNAEAHLRRGNVYAGKGQHDQAIADYTQALKLDRSLAAAYMNRGLSYAKTGDFERAARDADRALQLNPRLAGALFIRGTSSFKQGRYDLALADLDMLLLLEPRNVLAYNERGLVRAAREEFASAIADYSQALRLEPKFDLALFNRAIAHRLQGDHEQAIADFTEVIGRTPNNAQAYHHRGLAHFACKDHEQAIADFTRAFQLDPKCKQAYTSCMEVLRARNEREQPVGVPTPPKGQTGGVPQPPPEDPPVETGSPLPPLDEITLRQESSPAPAPRENEPVSAPRGKTEEKPPPRPAPAPKEPPKPPRSEPPATETSTETKPLSRAVIEVGKIRLECPDCGTMGLLDMRNLHKLFRCPGCSRWWRTDPGGRLTAVTDPDPSAVEVEAWKNTGERNKHRVPMPGGTPSNAPSRKPGGPLPRKTINAGQRSREGVMEYAGQWLRAFAATRTGRWMVGGLVLLALTSASLAVSPLIWPGALKTRGQALARAWLADDIDQMEQLTDATEVAKLRSWLEHHPPPELRGQSPTVNVAVERNDGRTADVVVQITAKDKKGQPAHYVFHHRWLEKDGQWYFRPPEAKASPGPPPKPPVTPSKRRR
jgi:tetratricopeptide (TPR) repeat protein